MEAERSQDSISEIVAASNEETSDPFDEEASGVVVPDAQPSKYDLADLDRMSKETFDFPTITAAREVAKIPPHIAVKDLVDIPIVLLNKTAQKAALPDTGELRDGFFCLGWKVETKEPFSTWVGQTALRRDLSALMLPFTATIVKHGRTYRFE